MARSTTISANAPATPCVSDSHKTMNGEPIVAARPKVLADAVSAKPHIGRKQLRCINAEQHRDLKVDRHNQQETGGQDQPWRGRWPEARMQQAHTSELRKRIGSSAK
jgi:hypothetical protein